MRIFSVFLLAGAMDCSGRCQLWEKEQLEEEEKIISGERDDKREGRND